jgi:DNA polymerase III delta prime subunit
MREVWAVKHRPNNLSEFEGQEHLIDEMKSLIDGEAGPQHYIFYSPEAGTGKTSLAHILATQLCYNIHKYNASSKRQRGIEFIEEELAPMTRLGQYETFFFLDEADQLTDAAQGALKGVIEDAQGYFILTCNDLSKVSKWLQSRCRVLTFEPISESDMFFRLHKIDAKEGFQTPSEHLTTICSANAGDLRNAINALQAYHSIPQEKREQFLSSLIEPSIDASRILTLCMKEKQVEEAVKLIGISNLRRSIDAIFDYGINSPAKPSSKLKLVECATQAQRDLINGVEAHYVMWDFCRRLSE